MALQIDWENWDPTTPLTMPLSSSAISSIYYDPITWTLTITFTDGTDYDYDGVPLSVVIGLVEAPSAGYFFNKMIRGIYD